MLQNTREFRYYLNGTYKDVLAYDDHITAVRTITCTMFT